MSILFRCAKSIFSGCIQANSAFLKSRQGVISAFSVMSSEVNPTQSTDDKDKKEDEIQHKKFTRYCGRNKKRQWEDAPGAEIIKKRIIDGVPFVRIKRRKMVMLLAYAGGDFFGMQRNPGVKTVEDELLKALLDTNYITLEHFNQIQELCFQRSSRTDKGVSAARQVVSLKIDPDADIAKINEKLPPELRIFGMKRVTKGFDSKKNCDARTYTYTLPTYAFEDHGTKIEDYVAYRTTTAKIERMNEILENYKGCKNYHNFTIKLSYENPSSKRYMINFCVDKIFVADGMEFAVLKVQGQSFVMHQIRKMVAMALAIIRGHTTIETLHNALTSDIIDLPTAPGLGLMLDYVHYTRYNYRYGDDGMHSPITWDEVENEIEKFKTDFILPSIIGKEVLEKPMVEWLEYLTRHSYAPRDEASTADPDGVDSPESDVEDDEVNDAGKEKDEIKGETVSL